MKRKIVLILTAMVGVLLGAGVCAKYFLGKMKKQKEMQKKDNEILKLYCQWMNLRQKGKSVSAYLEKKGYRSVAVYGMHYLGENLVEELANSNVEIKYAIDRNADKIYNDEVNIVLPESDLEEVDAIIVTAFFFFDEIEEILAEKINCPIFSIEDIIYEL